MALAALPGSPEKKLESRNARKVLSLLAMRLKPLGFQRTKPTFFTRPGPCVIEFVHLHKYTFGPCFRVHLGVRVRSDDFIAAALNGPTSDGIEDPDCPGRRLQDFEFVTEEASLEACAELLHQWVISSGLPWFASLAQPAALLDTGSPLRQEEKAALRLELENPTAVQVSAATLHALNAA